MLNSQTKLQIHYLNFGKILKFCAVLYNKLVPNKMPKTPIGSQSPIQADKAPMWNWFPYYFPVDSDPLWWLNCYEYIVIDQFYKHQVSNVPGEYWFRIPLIDPTFHKTFVPLRKVKRKRIERKYLKKVIGF